MSILGTIAEYNPFHRGHAYHLAKCRELTGADGVVCVMSGDFVQRGEPALFTKHIRAEAAVKSGVDLVVELPLPWSISSAEGFARGAVGLLGALGVVTHLGFGSETGDLAPLCEIAKVLLDGEADAAIKSELKTGISYAFARQSGLAKIMGDTASLLKTPNNILAVEYLKAIITQALPLKPVAITRVGAAHDETAPARAEAAEPVKTRGAEAYRSASDLRQQLLSGGGIFDQLPAGSAETIKNAIDAGIGPISLDRLEQAVLSRLRLLGEGAFQKTPGASEGLGLRLCKAAWSEPTVRDVLNSTKSKRYAMSRLRRMIICAVLGVTQAMSEGTPPYIRVLAMNNRGREILVRANERATLPIVIKPASLKEKGGAPLKLFELSSLAHDFYRLGCQSPEARRGGEDWRHAPVPIDG